MALYVRLMVYTGLSLFIIRRANLYLVLCILMGITLQKPRYDVQNVDQNWPLCSLCYADGEGSKVPRAKHQTAKCQEQSTKQQSGKSKVARAKCQTAKYQEQSAKQQSGKSKVAKSLALWCLVLCSQGGLSANSKVPNSKTPRAKHQTAKCQTAKHQTQRVWRFGVWCFGV